MESNLYSPLTYEQAKMTCQKYGYLIGTLYDNNIPGKGQIVSIAPAPFDEARRWQFAQFYRDCNNEERALQFYKGVAFAPLIISIPVIRKRSIIYQDLRDYLRENDVLSRSTRQPNTP